MTSETLAAVAAVVLQLLFEYVPGLADWFQKLEATRKRLVMLLLLAGTALGSFGLSCVGPYDFVACDQAGAWHLAELFILSVAANQGAHRLFKKDGQG